MSSLNYEVRVCTICGLRYPISVENSFGTRCPHCLGETDVVHTKTIRENELSKENPIKKETAIMAVLVDNVRSAWNVGSILRSADGFGFDHAYLCGISPTPEQEAVQKTSLGAEEYVTWSYHKDATKLVKGLRLEGWRVLGLEEEKQSVSLDKAAIKNGEIPTVLIVGNEVTGVDPGLLKLCDEIIHIPMHGQKRSFNVAVAFGIAAYAIKSPGK